MTTTRRHFLRSALAAGLAASPAAAIEPIARPGPSHLRLSLSAYGYRKYLAIDKNKKQAMTLAEFIDAAADMGVDAVELTAYYFPETSPEYLASLKGRATRLGLDVSAAAVGNDFCHTDAAAQKKQLASVKEWVEHTSRLGGKTLRIFAGGVKKGDTEEKARARCVAAIQEACDHAGKYGVYLALENHGGITGTADQLLAIVRAVKHDWFGVNFDSGNFHVPDPYAELEKIAPYAVVAQVKTEIQRGGKMKKEEADLKRMIDILRAANFRGYVALEYEAAEEPKTAVPRHVATLRKLMS